MADWTESLSPATASRQVSFREDCWTEEATSTLVDAWGRRYLELNRGNLRQKDWQEVADDVNARHGHTMKARRSDVQCKNRIDTLKKKYKIEKGKIESPEGAAGALPWPFFSRMDLLIGSSSNNHQNKLAPPPPPMAVSMPFRNPLSSEMFRPVLLPQKRPMRFPSSEELCYRQNYSAMAAAAAASVGDEEGSGGGKAAEEEEGGGEGGMKRLAKAIERFGDIYEKVENMKQRQMVELEKQRMQFAKDLEVQRMRLFMDTQVELEKLKHARRTGSAAGVYSYP